MNSALCHTAQGLILFVEDLNGPSVDILDPEGSIQGLDHHIVFRIQTTAAEKFPLSSIGHRVHKCSFPGRFPPGWLVPGGRSLPAVRLERYFTWVPIAVPGGQSRNRTGNLALCCARVYQNTFHPYLPVRATAPGRALRLNGGAEERKKKEPPWDAAYYATRLRGK